jgi:hypothetical protein
MGRTEKQKRVCFSVSGESMAWDRMRSWLAVDDIVASKGEERGDMWVCGVGRSHGGGEGPSGRSAVALSDRCASFITTTAWDAVDRYRRVTMVDG